MNDKKDQPIDKPAPMFWRIIVSVILSFVLTAVGSVVGWLTISNIEIDRTQEVVLQRLDNIEMHMARLEAQLDNLPGQIDDEDRWRHSEEMLYQKATEDRLQRLELYHPPYLRNR